MLADTPASLRDPQLEQKAALLSEKVRILEEGLGRFVGREQEVLPKISSVLQLIV